MTPNKSEKSAQWCLKKSDCGQFICCNLSVGVVLNVRLTTNGMYVRNNTHIYVAQRSINRISTCYLYCWLLPQCVSETLFSIFRGVRLLEKLAYCTIIHLVSSEASFQLSVAWLQVCLWCNLSTKVDSHAQAVVLNKSEIFEILLQSKIFIE